MTETLKQDLSELIDGELPPDRAAFLLRRLGHDDELQGVWTRWHLAQAGLRRAPQRLLPEDFAATVGKALADEAVPATRRMSPVLRWVGGGAVAASVALAALLLMPTGPSPGMAEPALVEQTSLPTASGARLPASALTEDDLRPRFRAPAQTVSASRAGPVLTLTPVAEGLDAETQLYLLRHQASLRQEGLGGFAPYVEVLAHPQAETPWRPTAWAIEDGDR